MHYSLNLDIAMGMLTYGSKEVGGIVLQNKPVPLNETLSEDAIRLKKEVGRSWISQGGVY